MDRCVGWSTALGQTLCGQGYRQGAFGCGGCSPGYYSLLGVCTQCPAPGAERARAVGVFLTLLFGLLVVVVATSVMLTTRIVGSKGAWSASVDRCG